MTISNSIGIPNIEDSPLTRLPRPPHTSTYYLSDDSGVGTGNTSDMSDECGICSTIDVSGDHRGTYNNRNRSHFKIKNSEKQNCCVQTCIYHDQIKEKEKHRHKVETLYSMKCLIAQKMIATDNCIKDIMTRVDQLTNNQEEERVNRYLQDMEMITLLMSSLARRLARTELRLRMEGVRNYQELVNQIRKIQEQLDDANKIDQKLKVKYERISQLIETCLGVEDKEDFLQLMINKSKLLITSRELDEKIHISNGNFRMI